MGRTLTGNLRMGENKDKGVHVIMWKRYRNGLNKVKGEYQT